MDTIKFYRSSRFCLLLVLGFLIGGCATSYEGSLPNFGLKGEAAELEIQKFSLHEGYFVQMDNRLTMGLKGERYFIDSLKPVLAATSPEALQEFERAQKVRYAERAALLAASAILILNLTQDDDVVSPVAFYGLIGVGLGFSIYKFSLMNHAAGQYNRDLVKHFTPTLGLNIQLPLPE